MNPRRLAGRGGFSLTEIMVGLAVSGLLGLVAMPKVQDAVDRARVKNARAETYNRLTTARLAAQQGGRVAVFKVSGNLIWAEARPRLVPLAGSSLDTLGSITDLRSQYKVTITSTLDSVVFDPNGLGTGTGAIRLAIGGIVDSVAIRGFGSVVR